MRVAIDAIIYTFLLVNLAILGFNAIFGENPDYFAMSNKALCFKLGFGFLFWLAKKFQVLSQTVIAFLAVNTLSFYLLLCTLTVQKNLFIVGSEAYHLAFSTLEKFLIDDNLELAMAVHAYSIVAWYGLCLYFGKFDDIDSGFVLYSVISFCLLNYAVNLYTMHANTCSLRDYIKKIKELKCQIQNIFETIPEAVFVVKSDLSIILKNNSAESIISENSHNFIKEVMLGEEDNCTYLAEMVSQLVSKGNVEDLTLGKSKLGDKTFEWKARLVSWEGEPAVTLLMRDVTATIQLEQVKHEAHMKNVMLRSVSHELRTPANAFKNLLERTINSPNIPEKERSMLELAHDNCQHLLHVVNDLLDFSQFLHGTFRLAKQKFDIRQTLRNSFKPYEYMIKAAGLEAVLEVDSTLPTFGFNDPNRLCQVVMNLLSNATKFTRKGGIKVFAKRASELAMKVTVSDSGVGISEKHQSFLCTLFGRLMENESLNPQGCGLGLHISNLLAVQLGGSELKVDSALGEGAAFSFMVQLREEGTIITDYTTEIDEDKSAFIIPVFDFTTKISLGRVLVVDDNVFNRDIVVCILEDFGVECFAVSSGVEAIRVITESPNPFNLMFLDFEMPDLNGPQTAKCLKEMQTLGKIEELPVIVAYTAYSSQKDMQECKDAGMEEFLNKPCSAREVQMLVQKYC
mmetsp:Transcript_2050/g.4691  ORF Transcript_2050/g.4691 Transcript_2050/m.4691 type:complete len:684 (-) Transcript_2050:170-2221(-)